MKQMIAPGPKSRDRVSPYQYLRDPEQITRQSFDLISNEVDVSHLSAENASLLIRMIHASGMTNLVDDFVASEGAARAGKQALASGAPILCDSRMVAAGIMTGRLPADNDVLIGLDQVGCDNEAATHGTTRSAAGLSLMADRFEGSIVAIGNAPTALFRTLELIADGAGRPSLLLGLPVGFVGAVESKDALIENKNGLHYATVRGRRGGSAVTSAALNALLLS